MPRIKVELIVSSSKPRKKEKRTFDPFKITPVKVNVRLNQVTHCGCQCNRSLATTIH